MARTYIIEPVGFDAFDDRVRHYAGRRVRKVQPFGGPKNGTMGHCYVETVDTGEFVGLVLLKSLAKANF